MCWHYLTQVKATFAITHFIFKTMQPKSSASVQFDTKYQMAIMRAAFTNRRVSMPISLVWRPLAQRLGQTHQKVQRLGAPYWLHSLWFFFIMGFGCGQNLTWFQFHFSWGCNFHIYRVYHGLLKLIHIYKIKRNSQAKNLTESELFQNGHQWKHNLNWVLGVSNKQQLSQIHLWTSTHYQIERKNQPKNLIWRHALVA